MNKKISQLISISSIIIIFTIIPLRPSFAEIDNSNNGEKTKTFSECKNAYLNLYIKNIIDKDNYDGSDKSELKKKYNDVKNTSKLIKQLDKDIKGFDAINAEFIKKIDAKLKTTQPSSALINQMVREYLQYKKEIYNEFSKFKINGTPSTYKEQQYVLNVCIRDRDIALKQTKDYMMQFIKNNSAKKKTARLVEKFEQLNDKMQGFDSKVINFNILLLTMKSKLPNFVKNCLTAKK